jgi:hypothetical protein
MTGRTPARRRNETGQFEAPKRGGTNTSADAGSAGATPALSARRAGIGRPSLSDLSSIQSPPGGQEDDGVTPSVPERHAGIGRPSAKDLSSIRPLPEDQEDDSEMLSLSELVAGIGRRSAREPSPIQSPSIEEEVSLLERLARREGKLPARRRSSTVPSRPHVDSEVASNYSLQEDETSGRTTLQ